MPVSTLSGLLEPDAAADRGRGGGMVAGNHLDADAGTVALGDRLDGLGAGRIDQAHDAEEGERAIDVVVLEHGVLGGDGSQRKPQHALPLRRDAFGLLAPPGLVERRRPPSARALLPRQREDWPRAHP